MGKPTCPLVKIIPHEAGKVARRNLLRAYPCSVEDIVFFNCACVCSQNVASRDFLRLVEIDVIKIPSKHTVTGLVTNKGDFIVAAVFYVYLFVYLYSTRYIKYWT